jgi:hypothetical protein
VAKYFVKFDTPPRDDAKKQAVCAAVCEALGCKCEDLIVLPAGVTVTEAPASVTGPKKADAKAETPTPAPAGRYGKSKD